MKWAGLTLFVLVFPFTVWIFQGHSLGRHGQEMTQSVDSTKDVGKAHDKSLVAVDSHEVDLAKASAVTIRKIKDIDNKIEAARTELRQTEAVRQTVIQDLIKIQAKIDRLVKADPQL